MNFSSTGYEVMIQWGSDMPFFCFPDYTLTSPKAMFVTQVYSDAYRLTHLTIVETASRMTISSDDDS